MSLKKYFRVYYDKENIKNKKFIYLKKFYFYYNNNYYFLFFLEITYKFLKKTKLKKKK